MDKTLNVHSYTSNVNMIDLSISGVKLLIFSIIILLCINSSLVQGSCNYPDCGSCTCPFGCLDDFFGSCTDSENAGFSCGNYFLMYFFKHPRIIYISKIKFLKLKKP